MRTVATLLALLVSTTAGAQVIEQPKLPTKPTLATIAVRAFEMQRVSNGFALVPTVVGMDPTHYQISKYSDFRDATWLAWPSTNRPIWQGEATGACGASTVRVIGYFRVRAPRAPMQFVTSNAAVDTVCIPFG